MKAGEILNPVHAWAVAEAVPVSEAVAEASHLPTVSATVRGPSAPRASEEGLRPQHVLQALASRQGLPPGLADVVSAYAYSCAVRYFICDNSGSMQTQDGKVAHELTPAVLHFM